MRHWQWEYDETGENLGYTTTETGVHGYPLCPNCGKETHYCYGQVDETEQGIAVYAEWYDCDTCGIGTPLEYED